MATATAMTAAATQAALDLKADADTTLVKNNNLNDVQDKKISRENLNIAQRYWFDVRDYLAVGDGSADDTVPINNAIAACAAAGGGTVYLPHGTYSTSGTIVITNDNIVLKGENRGATKIKPVTGATFDVIATPIPSTAGTAGYIRSFIGVEDLTIDGSSMAGTVAGKGNGIHFYGVRYSHIRNVNITGVLNWGIILDGDITNFSYGLEVHGNRIINGSAGILCTFSEENFIVNNHILQANLNTSAAQPAFDSPDNVGYLVRLKSGYTLLAENVIGSSGTHTSPAVLIENSGPTKIIGNRFDQTRYQAIRTIAGNNIIVANQFGNCSSVGSVEVIRLGATDNVVEDNFFDLTNGAAHYTWCIYEPSAKGNQTIIGNHVLPGTSGTIHMDPASTNNRVQGNVGYNPIGFITAPTVPASGVAYTNNYGTDATVYISGGTVSNISIGGTALGTGAGFFRVPSGMTIAVTYTSVPTWKWCLD